ncbi:hypothetical protein [Poriferisphaera sp. WC338]|uniref:hypothetical protein n=1 Tax=Poriferisphaera sp. WC338 TaxID=3425129 RepID=UPI003D818E54
MGHSLVNSAMPWMIHEALKRSGTAHDYRVQQYPGAKIKWNWVKRNDADGNLTDKFTSANHATQGLPNGRGVWR